MQFVSDSKFVSEPDVEHPIPISQPFMWNSFMKELKILLHETQTRKLFLIGTYMTLIIVLLLFLCSSSNSIALTAYVYVLIFDMFSIGTCVISNLVQKQRRTATFSFGYERVEVLAVFASTTVAQLGAFFIAKESVERLFLQPDINSNGLIFATLLAFFSHMLAVYVTVSEPPLSHVIQASSTSWLQEHAADLSQSLCHFVPGLSKILLPRINPFALVGFAAAVSLFVVHVLIETRKFYAADTLAATAIAIMICGTMFPMSVYSGKILLQTVPSYIVSQLDKCLREAQTLDGVLEFRNEHFWTLSFGTLAGSIQVRIRRDADEQLVLAHVYHRLANLVSVLTVQIFKDDWLRPSAMHLISDQALMARASAPPGNFQLSQSHLFAGQPNGYFGNLPNSAGYGSYGLLSGQAVIDVKESNPPYPSSAGNSSQISQTKWQSSPYLPTTNAMTNISQSLTNIQNVAPLQSRLQSAATQRITSNNSSSGVPSVLNEQLNSSSNASVLSRNAGVLSSTAGVLSQMDTKYK